MLKLTNRKTIETYSYKYIVTINNRKYEILSNFDDNTFKKVLTRLSECWTEIKSFNIKECIEFYYTNENKGITLDVLRNYL